MAGGQDMGALFKAGIYDGPDRMKVKGGETACAAIFYGALFVQVVMSFVVIGSQNVARVEVKEDGYFNAACPGGYMYAPDCGLHTHFCVKEDLCDSVGGRRLLDRNSSWDIQSAMELIAREEGPATEERQAFRRLIARRLFERYNVPENVWEFHAEFVFVPIILYGAMFFVAAAWLAALHKQTRAVVWGTIVAEIAFMYAIVVWTLVELDEVNYAFLVAAILATIGAVVFRKQIQTAIVVLTKATDGLAHNKRLFPVSFGAVFLWGGYFALWICSLLAIDHVKEVEWIPEGDEENGYSASDNGHYTLHTAAWAQNLKWLWIVMYYWVTYFLKNVKLIVVALQLAEWYFKPESPEAYKEVWKKALKWILHPNASAGGNAICSAIQGLSQYLLRYVSSKTRLCLACLNPIEWIPVALAFALRACIFTYTRYGLIGYCYSGESFCAAAQKTAALLKSRLGEAFICSNVAALVMNWCTYVLSVGVALSAFSWAIALQGIDPITDLGFLIGITIVISYFVSNPFLSIFFVVVIENLLPEFDGQPRAWVNASFLAIFSGSLVRIIMENMSDVVTGAMDGIYFCFAVEASLGQKQERFADLYEAIKMTIVPGVVGGPGQQPGVVLGMPAAQTMTVLVPPGVTAGSTLQVQGPNGLFQVVVPEGVAPGQGFAVQVPPPAVAAPAAQTMTVPVPPGVLAGTMLQVQGPNGPFQVAVPEGVAPGQSFTVQVPPPVEAAPAVQATAVAVPVLEEAAPVIGAPVQ